MAKPTTDAQNALAKKMIEKVSGEAGVYETGVDILTEDQAKIVNDFNQLEADWVASTAMAAGELAERDYKEAKRDVVTLDAKMGKMRTVSATVTAQKEVRIPPKEKGGEATTKKVAGHTRLSVKTRNTKNSGTTADAMKQNQDRMSKLFD